MKQPLLLTVVLALTAPTRALALDPARSLQQYHHTSWTQRDGAPADILAIAQSADGMLWLGSASGLYSFDGVRFQHIAPIPHDHTRSEQIRCLLITPDGTLWVGYRRGGLAVLRDGRLQPIPSPVGNYAILQIVSAPDRAIWVLTGNPQALLARLADGRWSIVGTEDGLRGLNEDSIAFAQNGDLWVAATKWPEEVSTLFLRQRGQARFVPVNVGIGSWGSLAIDHSERPWISENRGIRPVAMTGAAATPEATPPVAAPPSDTYTPIYFDRHDVLWAATTAGLGRIRPGEKTLELYGAQQGLSASSARSAMEDREGNLWVGTTAGLDRFRAANVVRVPSVPIGPLQNFHIVSDRQGTVYISNENALFRVRSNSSPQLVRDGLQEPRALCAGADGIWLTASAGLWRETGTGLQAIDTPASMPTAAGCAEDKTGALWLAEDDFDLLRYANGQWQNVKPAGIDFGENPAHHVASDSRGRLLAYLEGLGIARFDGLNFSLPWPFKSLGIGPSIFMNVVRDDIFVGGQYGLARLHGPTADVLDTDRFPWLRDVSGIAQSPAGETWLVTGGGVVHLPTASLDAAFLDPRATLAPEQFDLADGVPGPLATGAGHGGAVGAAMGADGRFWFFGDGGVAFIDPAKLERNPIPPTVLITAITAAGVSRAATSGSVLPAGTSNLQIDYTATSLSIPERVRFRYRMKGVDQDWVDPGSRRQAFYTKLGAGKYRFQVIAANNDGVWNTDGATLTFTIPPTFTQSWYFSALCATTAGIFLWWLYTMRLRQVANRVRDRLEHRISERERIARELHDTLLQGFQGLLLRFQAAANSIPTHHNARIKMEDALDLAETVLGEGRDRVKDLRNIQASVTLGEALSVAAARLVHEPAVAHVHETGTARALHPVVREEACRIGEEAIANATRHAAATLIDINIEYALHELRVSIADNGSGFDSEILMQGHRAGHFGLLGMRERAKQIKGELTIANRPGAGAEINLVVPASVAYADRTGFSWINAFRRWVWPARLSQ